MGRVESVLVILGLSLLGLLEAQNPGPAQSLAPVSVRDPALFPVCVSDSDCDKISEKGGLTYRSLWITNDTVSSLSSML